MSAVLKWAGAVAGVVVALAILVPAYVYLASEATIARRYPLPAIAEPATPTPKSVARGGHVVLVAGCELCHGADLEGRLIGRQSVLPVYAQNLRLASRTMSDGEFERAVRAGIAPDATSLWRMPSANYTFMSEDDLAAMLAFLRAQPPTGHGWPPPAFDANARLAIVEGRLVPSVLEAAISPSSLDLGPRYDGGRYIARISCSQCHGADLSGSPDRKATDLKIVSLYSRPAFFDLLRRGLGVRGRRVTAMAWLARHQFHVFADYEIMALYDYLEARTKAPAVLVARANANALRHHTASEKILQRFPQ
jgi:cytochrome c5